MRLAIEGRVLGANRTIYEAGSFSKKMYMNKITQAIAATEDKKSLQDAGQTERQLSKFRKRVNKELAETVNKLVRKTNNVLEKEDKLRDMIDLFITQPAQHLIEFRKSEKTGKSIDDYRKEWKEVITGCNE